MSLKHPCRDMCNSAVKLSCWCFSLLSTTVISSTSRALSFLKSSEGGVAWGLVPKAWAEQGLHEPQNASLALLLFGGSLHQQQGYLSRCSAGRAQPRS